MTAELQGVVAITVVAGAALYVARRAWTSWRATRLGATEDPSSGCGTGCDCH
jgi:hypothetical protein